MTPAEHNRGQASAPDFLGPKEDCDIIMKGGITSGVIYPRVVIELAREKYRFRSIGGTSAGAIAAAVTAAAEHGRQQERARWATFSAGGQSGDFAPNPDLGFAGIERIVADLSTPGFLANLFQPAEATRPLFNVFLSYLLKSEARRQVVAPGAAPPAAPARLGWLPRLVIGRLPPAWREHTELLLPEFYHFYGDRIGRQRGSARLIGAALGFLLPLALAGLLFGLAALFTPDGGWAPLVRGFALATALLGLLGAYLGAVVAGEGAALATVVGDTLGQVNAAVPRNFFGVCTGRSVPSHRDSAVMRESSAIPGLTDWLAGMIDRLAGKPAGQPLTFGDLGEPASRHEQQEAPTRAQGVTLRMVTTCLTRRQPYVLPFIDNNEFLFRREDLEAFFPPDVVRHLARYANSAGDRERFAGAPDHNGDWAIVVRDGERLHHFYRLPLPHDWPIVVAMRMSLSFPFLLSAVPLWTIRRSAYVRSPDRGSGDPVVGLELDDFEQHWFSDGGICSNFPIHFFDKWFPDSPTFGINLDEPENLERLRRRRAEQDGRPASAALDERDRELEGRYGDYIKLPKPNVRAAPRLYPLEQPWPFAWSIFQTALNYRDTLQAQLPSYAERIVTVTLEPHEGGLNLNMSPETIRTITAKGELAGRRIVRAFNFEHHRWVRLRLLFVELTEHLQTLRADLRIDQGQSWDEIERQLAAALAPLNIEVPGDAQLDGVPLNSVQRLLLSEQRARLSGHSYPYAVSRGGGGDPARLLTEDEKLRLNLLVALIALWGDPERGPIFGTERLRSSQVQMRITPNL